MNFHQLLLVLTPIFRCLPSALPANLLCIQIVTAFPNFKRVSNILEDYYRIIQNARCNCKYLEFRRIIKFLGKWVLYNIQNKENKGNIDDSYRPDLDDRKFLSVLLFRPSAVHCVVAYLFPIWTDTHSGNDQPNNCVFSVQWVLGWTPKKDSILEQRTVMLLTCFLNSRDPKSNLVWVIMFYKQQIRGLVSYFTNFDRVVYYCCLIQMDFVIFHYNFWYQYAW